MYSLPAKLFIYNTMYIVFLYSVVPEPAPQGSVFWRVSSGLYNTASGAVGLGVGGVKWVAGKSYDVGSTVVSHVKVPSIPRLKRKDKNE